VWFGDALAFRADKLGFMERAVQRGPVVELRLGRSPTFLLSDPADIRHVLVTEEPRFSKNPLLTDVAEPRLFGAGLVAAPEEEHRVARLSLQPAFNHRQLAGFADAIEECARDVFVDGELALPEAAYTLAQRVRRRVLLGHDEAGERIDAALRTRQRYINQAFVSPLPFADRLPSRARREYRRAQDELERVLLPFVRGGGQDGTLLAALTRLELGGQRTFDEARGFLASYELSALGLAWTLVLLAQHREVQAGLRLDGGPLGYPQLVYSEALRLYPPTWLFVRVTPEAVRLPSGAELPSGARLFLCPYATHRDRRHFPDPERFDPHRERPRGAYFPFGGGRHVCIGEGFVRLEAAVILGRLASSFDLDWVDGGPVRPVPGATLQLAGRGRIRLKRRAPSGPSVSMRGPDR
jgi:cytochrome P450